jgi:hypothetical protein
LIASHLTADFCHSYVDINFNIFCRTKLLLVLLNVYEYEYFIPKFSQISYQNIKIDQFLPKMPFYYSKFYLKIVSDNRGCQIKKLLYMLEAHFWGNFKKEPFKQRSANREFWVFGTRGVLKWVLSQLGSAISITILSILSINWQKTGIEKIDNFKPYNRDFRYFCKILKL